MSSACDNTIEPNHPAHLRRHHYYCTTHTAIAAVVVTVTPDIVL